MYEVFTCSTKQILTFFCGWGAGVFVASLRDLRARQRTALSQQRAAVLKNAGLQDYTRVTFTLAKTWLRVMR